MPDTPPLSEAKRALLERYLRGEVPQTLRAVSTAPRDDEKSIASLSDPASRCSIEPIQTGGSKRPFFYLHVHWQGGAFYCFTLARDLGTDQPFYVLEPYTFDGLAVLPSLETMATAYIEAIRAVQPEGPYLLGGFCGGGLIALEMAQQLRAQGEAIDLLLLIEPKAGPAPLELIAPKLVGGFIRRLGKLIRLDRDKQLNWFLRLRHLYMLRHPQYRQSPGISLLPTTKTLRQDWLGLFTWVIADYSPRPYPGKITYFWADKEPGNHIVLKGKMAKAEEIEVHFIPGTTNSCRNEHLHDMACYLGNCLSKAQATSLS